MKMEIIKRKNTKLVKSLYNRLSPFALLIISLFLWSCSSEKKEGVILRNGIEYQNKSNNTVIVTAHDTIRFSESAMNKYSLDCFTIDNDSLLRCGNIKADSISFNRYFIQSEYEYVVNQLQNAQINIEDSHEDSSILFSKDLVFEDCNFIPNIEMLEFSIRENKDYVVFSTPIFNKKGDLSMVYSGRYTTDNYYVDNLLIFSNYENNWTLVSKYIVFNKVVKTEDDNGIYLIYLGDYWDK